MRPALALLLALTGLAGLWLAARGQGDGGIGPTAVTNGATSRVSIRTGGEEANGDSYRPAVSSDGRYIAFESSASNLVSGDTNGVKDIFVHDRSTGTTTRVSRRTDGGQANFDSFAPAISGDGRYVAFASYATNLVGNDFNNVPDVFLHDRETGQTSLVSAGQDGFAGNDLSGAPAFSRDGNYIAFHSYASNLVGGDTNGRADIFRYDRRSGAMVRASVDSSGAGGNGHSLNPVSNNDGSRIAFASLASNLAPGDTQGYQDIFLRDLGSGQTTRVSVGHDGAEGLGDSSAAAISDDGLQIAFASLAGNLVPGDSNSYADIFVRDRAAGTTIRVSVASGGGQAGERSDTPAISGDGRYIAFHSRASNLVPDDTNGVADIFLHDRQTGTTSRISLSSTGVQANNASYEPAISGDGRFVPFQSPATNLVAGDNNGKRDIFLRDRTPPPPPTPTPTFTPLPSPTPTHTPTPVPQVEVNHRRGAPGSSFTVTGVDFPASGLAVVQANATVLGSVSSGPSGEVSFLICSDAGTDTGLYAIIVTLGTAQNGAPIWLDPAAPVHPPAGSGPTFCLPDGIALTRHIYFPLVRR